MRGPFYIKENGEYALIDACKDCAFCSQDEPYFCCLNDCIVFPDYQDNETEEEETDD